MNDLFGNIPDYRKELLKEWFNSMFETELKEIKGTLSNEELWEKSYDDQPNVHTDNIESLRDYINVLTWLQAYVQNS